MSMASRFLGSLAVSATLLLVTLSVVSAAGVEPSKPSQIVLLAPGCVVAVASPPLRGELGGTTFVEQKHPAFLSRRVWHWPNGPVIAPTATPSVFIPFAAPPMPAKRTTVA